MHSPIDQKVHDLAMIIITMSFDSLINVDHKFHINFDRMTIWVFDSDISGKMICDMSNLITFLLSFFKLYPLLFEYYMEYYIFH